MSVDNSMKYLLDNEITKLYNEVPNYLESLDEYQKIVATNICGNILVLAGPGAGKTHTLVYRVLHMIYTGIDPKEICIITFTRRAAEELKYRINQILVDVEIGFAGTFHALALYIEETHGKNKYRLLDPDDDRQVIKLVKEVNNIKFINNIKASTIQKIFSYSYNTKSSIKNTLVEMMKEKLYDDIDMLIKLEYLYNDYKIMNNYSSYDDLLKVNLEDVKVKNLFEFVMIDEYQDTNNLQIEFIKHLFKNNVMAIGDEFQSIYGFRGSNPKIILNFGDDFENAKMIILKNNYRSTDEIVDKINYVINNCDYGFKKNLEANIFSDDKIEIIPTLDSSSDYVDLILKNIKLDDKSHALIYRASRERGKLEAELIKLNIDYVVYGGIRLLERRHIKDIMSIVLTCYSKSDEISFMRALTIINGIGSVRAAGIIREYPNHANFNYPEQLDDLLVLINQKENPSIFIDLVYKWYLANKKHLASANYTEDEITQDIQLLKTIACEYTDMLNFINDLVINPVLDKKTGNSKCRVFLSTVHSCKGLEFDYVYHLHGQNFWDAYNENALEESRRLFYVAISRAREKLYILDQKEISRSFEEILFDFSLTGYSNRLNHNERLKSWNKMIDERLVKKKISEPCNNLKLKYLINQFSNVKIASTINFIEITKKQLLDQINTSENLTLGSVINYFYEMSSLDVDVYLNKHKVSKLITSLDDKDYIELKEYIKNL